MSEKFIIIIMVFKESIFQSCKLARPKNGPFFCYVAIVIVFSLVALFIIFNEQGKMMNKMMSGKKISFFFLFFSYHLIYYFILF